MSRYFPRVRAGADSEVQRDLRTLYETVYRLTDSLEAVVRSQRGKQELTLPEIKRALSSGGSHALSVQGLLGVLSQPQVAGAPVVSALPGPEDPRSQDGALVTFGGAVYVYNESSQTWTSATGSVTSVNGTSGTSGFSLAGGPITASGTLTFTVSNAESARGSLGLPKQNYAAVAAPGASDDSAAGYSVGSPWVDTSAGDAYVCVDASVGAAVWKKTTP